LTRRAEVRLDHAGTSLFALDQGEGPPLLFFHGGLADHRAALVHVGSLADRLRVITPDLRGAGRSTWAGPLDWERFADDAVALVRHLGLRRVVVGGVSMGSAVAVRTALSHPDLVAGLVLVHPVYPGADLGLSEVPRRAMQVMDEVGRRAPAEGISVLHPMFDALPEAIRARARAMVDSFDPRSVAATTRFLASEVQPFGTASELAAVRCPALVVPGVDPSHPAEVATLLAGHLPDATLHSGDAAEAIGRFCLRVGQRQVQAPP
jgi:pimeloyl-ACP methyl ester carboxylesterase